MPRVLLIKFGAIGDATMLLPAAHQLHLAGMDIDWVCGPTILPILQLYPWINPILADDRAILLGSFAVRAAAIFKLWRMLAGRSYEIVATLYYDHRYAILALPIRAPRKFMLSHSGRDRRILPGRHHTDEFARILLNLPDELRPTHLPPLPPLLLPVSPLPPPTRTRVILAPAGARNMLANATLRRWPAEHYVELTQLLLQGGCEVVLIGGPDDTDIRPLFADLPVIDVIGKLPLPETIALLDSADLFVTHDTGPLHLGGLTRASIVSIFGPTDPHVFAPRRPGTVALWGGEGFSCRPCYDTHSFAPCPSNDCTWQISPAMVHAELLSLLADRARGHLAPARIVTPAISTPASSFVKLEAHP